MKLNIGSGIHPLAGWVNIDLNDPGEAGGQIQIDVIASCLDLPFPDECADMAYFGHILEHLTYDVDAPRALREAHRCLKPGGVLGVVGPAMDLAIETQQPDGIIEAIKVTPVDPNATEPYGGAVGHSHLWEANTNNTFQLVSSVFPNALVLPVDQFSHGTGWPNVDTSPWQVAIFASKQ